MQICMHILRYTCAAFSCWTFCSPFSLVSLMISITFLDKHLSVLWNYVSAYVTHRRHDIIEKFTKIIYFTIWSSQIPNSLTIFITISLQKLFSSATNFVIAISSQFSIKLFISSSEIVLWLLWECVSSLKVKTKNEKKKLES